MNPTPFVAAGIVACRTEPEALGESVRAVRPDREPVVVVAEAREELLGPGAALVEPELVVATA